MNETELRLVEIASFSPIYIDPPSAWMGHLPFAAWLIKQLKPAIFVELGTHWGNSYFAFCQAVYEADLRTKCYAVDTWIGEEHAGFYSEDIFHKVNTHNNEKYEKFSRLLRMTFDEALDYFTDSSVELLHIDGFHTYEAVSHDFKTWLPKLAPGAIVLFHDINVRERGFGVWKFWEELKEKHPNHLEFLHSHGLGVLQTDVEVKDRQGSWLQPALPFQQILKNYFSALGARQNERYNLGSLEKEKHRLNLVLAEKDNQIASLNQAVTEREGQIASLNQIIEDQTATIAELRASTSWRVTQPLRSAGLYWRKTYNIATVTHKLMRQESLLTLGYRIVRTLRREGFTGVNARILQRYQLARQMTVMTAPLIASSSLTTTLEPAVIHRDQEGHYALSTPPGIYTYIEPQRPVNLSDWISSLTNPPYFAIVVPTYNTPPALLDALIESIISQWYPYWRLILADDASPSDATRSALKRINDQRIEVIWLEQNLGISGATNAAIAAATQRNDIDFIVFMDHDDELTVDCLYELTRAIEREQPDFIYSDEDKITADGNYGEPHFKPDWSPDTIMSTMFTCHVSCIRRAFLDQVGKLRSQFDGCQDWDFILRVSENTKRICHIPRVLYHWRVIPGSTASDIAAKSYILDASRRVREDALRRRRLSGHIEPILQMPGYFRVAYLLQGEPQISIVIPTRDNKRIFRRCIESIIRYTAYHHYEIIVMDNGSSNPATLEYLAGLTQNEGYPSIRVIRHDAPFNFSELNNLGVSASHGDLLLFLNDDTEVLQGDWLERLGGFAQLSHVGAVGAKLLFPGGAEVQHAGILNLENGPVHALLRQHADAPGYFMRNLLEYNWLAVTGACLMIERRKFDAIGGFAESLPVAYNDIDLCMRLVKSGYFNVVCPAVRLIHHESASRGSDTMDSAKAARLQRERAHLYERNPIFFQRDPFHNPNLHPNGLHFELPL